MVVKNESNVSKPSIVYKMSLEETIKSSTTKFREIVYMGWKGIRIGYKLFTEN